MLKYSIMALSILAAPVSAQTTCVPNDEAQKRNEAMGLYKGWAALTRDNSAMLEVWTRADGFWVLLAVRPDGSTCLLTQGDMNTFIDPKPEGVEG